jgi:hypothetical protein
LGGEGGGAGAFFKVFFSFFSRAFSPVQPALHCQG